MAKAKVVAQVVELNLRNPHIAKSLEEQAKINFAGTSGNFSVLRGLTFGYRDKAIGSRDHVITFFQAAHKRELEMRRKGKLTVDDDSETWEPASSDVTKTWNILRLGDWKLCETIFDNLEPLNPSRTALAYVAARFHCTTPWKAKDGFTPPVAKDATIATPAIAPKALEQYIKEGFADSNKPSEAAAPRTLDQKVATLKKSLDKLNAGDDVSAYFTAASNALASWMSEYNLAKKAAKAPATPAKPRLVVNNKRGKKAA